MGSALYPAARICPAYYGRRRKGRRRPLCPRRSREDRRAPGPARRGERRTSSTSRWRSPKRSTTRDGSPTPEAHRPLLAPIRPEGLRDATADIVAETTRLKKNWLNKAIKDEEERLERAVQSHHGQARGRVERRVEEYRSEGRRGSSPRSTSSSPRGPGEARDTAARMHQVYGDREPLELALLVALGAQLEPLPNGRPLGASILLTAPRQGQEPHRRCAVKPLPPEFYLPSRSPRGRASTTRPTRTRLPQAHVRLPQRDRGRRGPLGVPEADALEGRAKKIVTAKDPAGNMTTRTIIVEGPVTIAIPTIRNKTDEQLQTRLLVAELPDYAGGSSTTPRRSPSNSCRTRQPPTTPASSGSGRRPLGSSPGRRVVFPLTIPTSPSTTTISPTARGSGRTSSPSWRPTPGWSRGTAGSSSWPAGEGEAPRRSRPPRGLRGGLPLFTEVCKRTVINLSETHRKILGRPLRPPGGPSRARRVHPAGDRQGGRGRLGTVSNNKTFLVTSAKLIRRPRPGLLLVEGAEPSWWTEGDLIGRANPQAGQGPGGKTPRQIQPSGGAGHRWTGCGGTPGTDQKPPTYEENPVQGGILDKRWTRRNSPIPENGNGRPPAWSPLDASNRCPG